MADTTPTNIRSEAEKLFEIKDLGLFLKNLLNIAIIAGAIIAFAYLLWGAFDWITSEGDQEKIKSARNKLTHALLGLGVMAVIWLGWRLALYFLGIGQSTDSETIFVLPQ